MILREILLPEKLSELLFHPNSLSYEDIGKKYSRKFGEITGQQVELLCEEYKKLHPELFYLREKLSPEEFSELLYPPHNKSFEDIGRKYGNYTGQQVENLYEEYKRLFPDHFKKKLKDLLPPEMLAELTNPPNNMKYEDIGNLFKSPTREGFTRQRIQQLYKEYSEQYPKLFKKILKPDKKILENSLKLNLSLKTIAREHSITVGKLKQYMEEYGLEHKYINEVLTKEKLISLYVEKEMSDEEIAKKYSTSPNTVMKLRYEHEIYENMRQSLSDKITEDIFRDLYVTWGLNLKQIASLFNVGIQRIIDVKKMYNLPKQRSKGLADESRLAIVKKELIKKGVLKA